MKKMLLSHFPVLQNELAHGFGFPLLERELKGSNVKKMALISFVVLSIAFFNTRNASAQTVLFSQDFNSATAVAYTANTAVGLTTASGNNVVGNTVASQVTSITCNAKGNCGIGINDASPRVGKFYAGGNNTSFNWSLVKNTNFAVTAATALKVEITAAWIVGSSSSNSAGVDFAIGAGFANGYTTSEPATSIVHSGFTLQNNSTSRVAVYGTPGTTLSAAGITQTTSLKLTWIINNTGASISYTNPAGGSTTLANDKWDLWQGTTQHVTAASALTGTIDLQNLYIGNFGAKNNNITIDDITVSSLSTSSTDYFRSKASGNWSSTSTWESSSDNVSWINATSAPTSSANTVSILATHTVTVDANTTVSNTNIAATGVLNVAPGIEVIVPVTKTIANNGTFTLQSTVAGTASIGNSAGAVTGSVILQRYIPGGKRAFRFLGHPFSNTLNLESLTDNIIITGQAGTAFTPSSTNNPSAFWYNPATGDENVTNDIGWTAFTTTDGTGSGNGWGQYKAIRVLVRGSIADGLSPVTPSFVTIDATGTLNTGTQVIPVAKGTNSGYNFIGNPFASNINLTTVGGNVTLGSNMVTNFYVWDMTAGTKGGWVNPAFSSSYILPSFGGFIVKTSANDNITITEAAKTTTDATGTMFRNNNATPEMVRLSVTGNNINWDRFELYYNNESTLAEDRHDGVKFKNSEVNFYSIANGKNYSIDSRPFVKDDVIPMGFTSVTQQDYTIKASEYSLPAGVELYLRDKFLGTETKLAEGTEYTFSVTSNAASQGNERFELVQKKAPIFTVLPVAAFSVKLSPNPAIDMVKVAFSNEEKASTTITITNAEGKTVRTVNAGNVQDGQLDISIKGLAKGSYYVTLSNGTEKKTQQLQIQ